MNAQLLYREGRLTEAARAAAELLRDDPANRKLRTFLFELLSFAGEYERAEKHLALLAGGEKNQEVGALLYHAAIHAEQMREQMFIKGEWPGRPESPPALSGTLNGQPFASIEDADSRIGARLEVFAAGNYLWLPLEHIARLSIEPPRRVRDLLWTPARLETGPGCQQFELGEILLPALSPRSARHADDLVRLGRLTVWETEDDGAGGLLEVPYGQKMLLVDGAEVPLLEIRSLTIGPPAEGIDVAG
jgi:type VI secretion system protein ImpE